MIEVWKDTQINGYQVSNYGNVRSFKQNQIRILKTYKTKNGYLQVKIGKPQKNVYIHHLVASCFFNYEKSNRSIVIDHKDNNRLNNHSDNLQIIPNVLNTIKDKNNSTGYKAVRRQSINSYEARITINKKRIKIGNFKTAEEASDAYKKIYNLYYGNN